MAKMDEMYIVQRTYDAVLDLLDYTALSRASDIYQVYELCCKRGV
jgi:hypothetical protein